MRENIRIFNAAETAEMTRLLIAFILLARLTATGQTFPDSIIVIKHTYLNTFTEKDSLYRSETFPVIRKGNSYFLHNDRIAKSQISQLLALLNDSRNKENLLAYYQIDTTRIKSEPSSLLNLYSGGQAFDWNQQQREFIYKELSNLDNYEEGLNSYLSRGCCYSMHNSYRYEYIIELFNGDTLKDQVRSRKHVGGYKMPWTNTAGEILYNYRIEYLLNHILSLPYTEKAPMKGDKLLKYLVNSIIDNNVRHLYQLSAYTYQKEIEELSSDFTIVSFEEVYGRGRYIWDEPGTMKVVLKNEQMLDNVSLVFLATKQGSTIYSRDSIKKDYRDYISRIQSISFITDYIKRAPSARLDIYYFNNKGINDYNINGVNKTPREWTQHDNYLRLIEQSRNLGRKFSLDDPKAIKTSEQIHCGCNYRFERSYLEKAIFFEIMDDNGSSVWFLLPDNRVLLYILEGSKVLEMDRSNFGEKGGLLFPCALFDLSGQRMTPAFR